jgi:hypothetical protein
MPIRRRRDHMSRDGADDGLFDAAEGPLFTTVEVGIVFLCYLDLVGVREWSVVVGADREAAWHLRRKGIGEIVVI